MIKSESFYNNYHGHNIKDLKTLYNHLKTINSNKNFIYLAGDSSLDNKYWLKNVKGTFKLSNGGTIESDDYNNTVMIIYKFSVK